MPRRKSIAASEYPSRRLRENPDLGFHPCWTFGPLLQHRSQSIRVNMASANFRISPSSGVSEMK
jgi:hypothetical protein